MSAFLFGLLAVGTAHTAAAATDIAGCDASSAGGCGTTSKGSVLLQRASKKNIYTAADMQVIERHEQEEASFTTSSKVRGPPPKPPPPPKPAAPPPRPDSGSSGQPGPPVKEAEPTPAPTPEPDATGQTGLACNIFDDCKDSGEVTGFRPHCVCSNGCIWGVTCGRDAVVLASEIFSPDNHCDSDGTCSPGKPLMIAGKLVQKSPQRFCFLYNEGHLLPELSGAGYCLGVREKSYTDFCMAVVVSTLPDFAKAFKWSLDNSPEENRVECSSESFCLGGEASGEMGNCKCVYPEGQEVDRTVPESILDRFAVLWKEECTDDSYCSGNGQATFTSQEGAHGGGSCSCNCAEDYSGHHCEYAPGDPCNDAEDCSGHGIASGTRPNCECSNCMKFDGGDKCEVWSWYGTKGVFEGLAQTSNETTGSFHKK